MGSSIQPPARSPAERAVAVLTSRERRTELLAFAIAAVIVVALVDMLLETGVAHDVRFGHDTPIYLDAGWRVRSGQRPHVDFHSPLGLLTPLVLGAAMTIGPADATALGTAAVLFTVLACAWAAGVSRSRLSPALGAALVVVVACTVIGQNVLSFPYDESSHASIFNRFAYAVLCVVLVEALVPLAAERTSAYVLGGASTGAGLAALFFLKPSFVFQGVALVALGGVALKQARVRWLALAGGAFATTVLLLLLARTSLSAVLADYRMGAASRAAWFSAREQLTVFAEMSRRDSGSMTPAKLLEILRNDFWSMTAVLALAALVPASGSGLRPRWAGRRFAVAGVALALLASLPVVFTNWQWGETPTTIALGLATLELCLRGPRESAARSAVTLRPQALLALGGFLVLPFVVGNAASVAAAWDWHRAIAPRVPAEGRFQAAPLKPWLVLRSDGACQPMQYTRRVNDGLDLLSARARAANLRPESLRVVVFDFSNPFTFALRAPPPRGTELWWHLGATFVEGAAPSAADVLGDADVVLIPKCPEEPPTRDAMLRLYGPALGQAFRKDGETDYWTLLRKQE